MSLDLLTIGDVKKELNVSDKVVRTLIKNNELPAAKIGGEYRIAKSDLSTYFRSKVLELKKINHSKKLRKDVTSLPVMGN
jgi:excisionase family DNA binding protein